MCGLSVHSWSSCMFNPAKATSTRLQRWRLCSPLSSTSPFRQHLRAFWVLGFRPQLQKIILQGLVIFRRWRYFFGIFFFRLFWYFFPFLVLSQAASKQHSAHMDPFRTPDRDIVVANWGGCAPPNPPRSLFQPCRGRGFVKS